ncbi:amino acid transporter ANT1-like [Zingiber officinale]|uniref:Amino acid transporter transmembrane domain-containing protein n=1 Tax=Zingiber officinale TaxID=94328 RepID=A0A8J5EB30_ZINOF|nr:amino acid transporter ANT1-like [Zingiber officinale]KAG6469847.1 hypothetical protein ZIOFF_070780 [Zingiber officinale]
MGESGRAPLLEATDAASSAGARGRAGVGGGATAAQTLGNIVVSVVGTGVLGLPYAFRVAGWLAGSIGVALAGISAFYCMLLLVQCRQKLEEKEETNEFPHALNYGDLGAKAFGSIGRCVTEFLILIAQTGGSIAYVVFIGQNLSSIFMAIKTEDHTIMPVVFIFALFLPLEIALSFIRSLSSLAPFSAFADICNVLAMAIVITEDFQRFDKSFAKRPAFNGPWGLPFAGGVAVFCFEGFSMTLALEASMAEKRKFPLVLLQAFTGIMVAYICFGIFGYLAYGEETKDIITLNLLDNWSGIAVKVGLCIGLAFTFPIMAHPINEIIETKLRSRKWFQKLSHSAPFGEWLFFHGSRIIVLIMLCVLASFVPGFGNFVSFVGSTICALLSFVLPASFHLIFLGSEMRLWQKILDYGIVLVGVAFAVHGTYNAIAGNLSN